MRKTELADVEAWPVEELLAAVMIGGGSRRSLSSTARDTAVDLLAELGGLRGLASATEAELEARFAGVDTRLGRAGSARGIVAAFELCRRFANDTPLPLTVTSSADVAAWAGPRLLALDHEELWLLALDGRSHLRAARCVARGGLHGMGARAADPLRIALRAAASGFVLVHNHPSGDPAPSKEDLLFTQRVAEAAAVVGVPLLDHVVVGRTGFASVPFAGASGEGA